MALSPAIRNLPTRQLFEHLETLRAVFRLERFRNSATIVGLVDVVFELQDRARFFDVRASFDGQCFRVPIIEDCAEGWMGVPPADYDGVCVLHRGSTPR